MLPCRVQVREVKFHTIPTVADLKPVEGKPPPFGTRERPFAPLEIIGSVQGEGLGLVAWWDGSGEEQADAESMEAES